MRAARAHYEGYDFHVPARKVITRSAKRILRRIVSVKMGYSIACESSNEFDYAHLLDVRRDVAGFYCQFERIQFEDGTGQLCAHYPDFLVQFVDGTFEVHEVKSKKKANKGDFSARRPFIESYYLERGIVYRVIEDQEIKRQPALRNAKAIRAERHRSISAERFRQVVASFEGTQQLRLGKLEKHLGCSPETRAELLAMTLKGFIDMDWQTNPIGPMTLVTLVSPQKGDRR